MKQPGTSKLVCRIAWVPAIIVAFVIFVLAGQDSTTSTKTSTGVTVFLLSHILGRETQNLSFVTLSYIDGIVRVLAHMTEYVVFSLCVGFAVTVAGFRKLLRLFYMSVLSIAVSVMDEFFQIFVPGRSGSLMDVMTDSVGAVGIALLVYIFTKNRGKKADTKSWPKMRFIDFEIDNIGFGEAVSQILSMARDKGKHYIVTPNADHVISLQKDEEFLKIYRNADLVLTDGTPLMWITDSLGMPIREKITGADLFPAVCEATAKEKDLTIFLCGATDQAVAAAKENLEKKYPGVKIIGTYAPAMGFLDKEVEVEKCIAAINKKSADILVVGLGAPKQEKFLYRNIDRLQFHVALPVGAAINFEAGESRRAPGWIRKIGMEWFYRFLQEPGRLFRRYFVEDMKIFWLAWKYRDHIGYGGKDEDCG